MADEKKAKAGDAELAGMVLMSGDEVAWAGPMAVLGQQQEEAGTMSLDDEATINAGPDEDGAVWEEGDDVGTVAHGSHYFPPENAVGEGETSGG